MPSSFSGQEEETTRSSESLLLIYEHTRPQIARKRIFIARATIKSSFKMATHSEGSLSVTLAAGRQRKVLHDRWYKERDNLLFTVRRTQHSGAKLNYATINKAPLCCVRRNNKLLYWHNGMKSLNLGHRDVKHTDTLQPPAALLQ